MKGSLMTLPGLSIPAWLKPRKKPILQETAPVQGVSLIGALSPLAFAQDNIPGGQGYLSYRKMQHDPQIKACLSTKKVAVLSRGWEVHPASDAAPDIAVCDFVRGCLNDMRGSVLDVLYDAMDALALGVSILELNWLVRPADGMIGLQSIKAKDPAMFLFETDPFLNIIALRGIPALASPTVFPGRGAPGPGGLAEGELPVDKFIIYPFQPSYANPMGMSDLRAAYQSWFVKQQLQRWWAKYLEKFGMPTVAGSYDAKAGYGTQQQREFLSLLAAVHNESAMVYPNDMDVKLLEAVRTTDSGFDEAIAYLDRSMAKSILGQSLTSDSSDRGSTYALGAVQANVLSFYLQKLQRDLEDVVMNEQVIKRLVGYNFPPGTPMPTFHLGRVDDDRLAATAALMQTLITGGVVAPDEPWIRSYLGLPAAPSAGGTVSTAVC
jgi:phage gp29-like protein